MRKVSIAVSQQVWEHLKQEKQLGETYDNVLRRLLKIMETPNNE